MEGGGGIIRPRNLKNHPTSKKGNNQMSAFMVNNRTLSKIAKYMEACANYQIGGERGFFGLEFGSGFKAFLKGEGLVDQTTGKFSASLIHEYLYRRNLNALCFRYGKKEVKEQMCPSGYEPLEDEKTPVDVSYWNRKVWLANLYTVCRCYLYQIAEGDYREDVFFREFSEWVRQMASILANHVVEEVRRYEVGRPNKPWDEF